MVKNEKWSRLNASPAPSSCRNGQNKYSHDLKFSIYPWSLNSFINTDLWSTFITRTGNLSFQWTPRGDYGKTLIIQDSKRTVNNINELFIKSILMVSVVYVSTDKQMT